MHPPRTRFPGLIPWLCFLSVAFAPRVTAQPSADLEVQAYAGLNITGAVGVVYAIDAVDDLALTNDPSAWRCLEFLQLPASPYRWADLSAPATGRRFYRALPFDPPTNMVFIPPGTFRLGSPTNEVDRFPDEGPQTTVILRHGFWLGRCEVTQGEYLSVMRTNPSAFKGDLSLPVEQVSWSNAIAYCDLLTLRDRVANRIATNSLYRLPTEAEWEYAARAWTSTPFSFGEDPAYTNLTNHAWFDANSGGRAQPVGGKDPNLWGLHDMGGNVWEWCQDWRATYPGGLTLDPAGPATGTVRIIRGGGWGSLGRRCRSAGRGLDNDESSDDVGFRVVLAAAPP